ncbi:hypothetical protein [Hyphomicrobium sp. 99]|uniref:hypothetical protein n=1 Tax=Hyphomicrobium sp. 99 TaxID=1163419 RepID=UPI0005F800BD|nr:hypothetical protein [Hyphomicrobium sp. 99]
MSGFISLMDGLAPLQHAFWVAVAVALLGAAAVGIALAVLARFLERGSGQGDAPSKLIDADDPESPPVIRLIDHGRTRGLAASARHGPSHYSPNAPLF